jgi:hypothetical protein
MKDKLLYIIIVVSSCLLPASCEVDNFDTPSCQLFGSVVDEKTNEPIQQDLIEGSRIDYIQLNYSENPPTRQIRFQTDGSFRNNNLFAGTYSVRALRGNFIPTELETITINGATEHIFKSTPYIRIKNPKIEYNPTRGKVTATFSLDAITNVASIHLLGSLNANVAWSIRTVTITKNVNDAVNSETVYTLEAPVTSLSTGREYYFRIASLASGVSEAKHNYSAPVKFTIDNSNVIPEPVVDKGKLLDGCESLDGWNSGGTLILDPDSRRGDYSVKSTLPQSPAVLFSKVFTPFDTEVTKANGVFSFWLYISDVSKLNWDISPGTAEIEITSSGTWDANEIHWYFDKNLGLVNGWNHLELKLANGADNGCNLKAVNCMRIYHTAKLGDVVVKIDDIRFHEE